MTHFHLLSFISEKAKEKKSTELNMKFLYIPTDFYRTPRIRLFFAVFFHRSRLPLSLIHFIFFILKFPVDVVHI